MGKWAWRTWQCCRKAVLGLLSQPLIGSVFVPTVFIEGAEHLTHPRTIRINFALFNESQFFELYKSSSQQWPSLAEIFSDSLSSLACSMHATRSASRTLRLSARGFSTINRRQAPSGLRINPDRLWETLHKTCEWGAAHRFGEYVPSLISLSRYIEDSSLT